MREYEKTNSLIERLIDLHKKPDTDAAPLYNGLKSMSKLIKDEDDFRREYASYLDGIEEIIKSVSAPIQLDDDGNNAKDIKDFYLMVFGKLRANMLSAPKEILTEYCKSRNMAVSTDSKLVASLQELSKGHKMRSVSWQQVLEGELNSNEHTTDVIAALEVPRVLEFCLEEAKDWLHSVSNDGFDYNNALHLIYLFNFCMNDSGSPLTDDEFLGLITYYKDLRLKLKKANLVAKVNDPDALNNTKINIDRITENYRAMAKEYGKKQAISEMEKFLSREYRYLDIPSQRCLAIFDVLTTCVRGLGYKSYDAAKLAAGYMRVAPLRLEDAEERKLAVLSKNSYLGEGADLELDEAEFEELGIDKKDIKNFDEKSFRFDPVYDLDLISKAEAQKSISRYYPDDNRNSEIDITRILTGLEKPTKAELLAMVYQCCTREWFDYGKTDNDLILIKSHVIEFAFLAASCLEAALLPAFVWSHPLEASYVLSVIAFHDGLVLFNGIHAARADLGGTHESDREGDETKLFDSKTYKPCYIYQEMRCIFRNNVINELYNNFKNQFIDNSEKCSRWDHCFGPVDKVFSADFIAAVADDVCSMVKCYINTIIDKENFTARVEIIDDVVLKHTRWAILQAFVDRLKSEVFSAKLFNTTIYCKDEVKISFKKKKMIEDIESLSNMVYFRLSESSRLPKPLPDDICKSIISAAKENLSSEQKTVKVDFQLSRKKTKSDISKKRIEEWLKDNDDTESVLATCKEEWAKISEIMGNRGLELPKIGDFEMQQIAANCVLTRYVAQLYAFPDTQHWKIRAAIGMKTTTDKVKYIDSRKIVIGW